MNKLEPMIPQPPIRPFIKNTIKTIVHFSDGAIDGVDLDKLKSILTKKSYYLYFYRDCHNQDEEGYYITDYHTDCSGYIITDYDILANVTQKNGVKCVNGDIIFDTFDMTFDADVVAL